VNNSEILDKFNDIVVWRRSETRAPHKPLLILYALGALSRGEEKLLFSEIEKPMANLLKEFGPSRRSYQPGYPFWRLQNDEIWVLENADKCSVEKGNTDVSVAELRKYKVAGYFRDDIRAMLKSDQLLFADVVKSVLNANFPETLHEEIEEACGLVIEFTKKSRKRDPGFRERILRAYGYRCAICGFSAQMDGRHLALEAAHIKWHAAGGPDIESNGIAMCSLHHKLFDKGAFMIVENKMLISESVYGDSKNFSYEHMLLNQHGKELTNTIRLEYEPNIDWLKWHELQVFKGPARQV
jgi:putative restriction endonuclease